MFAAYGLDVLDTRAVSPRRMWVLSTRLPPAARTPGEEWSSESNLLALLIDHVANLTWVTLRASGAKNVSRPKPLPRPRRDRARAAEPRSEPHATGQAGGWGAAIAGMVGAPGIEVVRADGL